MSTQPAPDEITDEMILEHLKEYQQYGVIEYVVPTIPLGEEWVVGLTEVDGSPKIAKMNSDQALGFLIGAGAVARTLAKRLGVNL